MQPHCGARVNWTTCTFLEDGMATLVMRDVLQAKEVEGPPAERGQRIQLGL